MSEARHTRQRRACEYYYVQPLYLRTCTTETRHTGTQAITVCNMARTRTPSTPSSLLSGPAPHVRGRRRILRA